MAEENSGGVVSSTVIALSGEAAISLLFRSETAPASMSSWGVPRDSTAACWDKVSVTVRVLPATDWAAPVRVAPPADWPESRTCSFERSAVPESGSLKVIARAPLPVE